MARYIDAEKLEKDGWSASRTYQQDVKTMVYETKKMTDFPTADVVDKERYDILLEHANILAEEMRKYQNADVPEKNVGKWIPVTERLPKNREWVLGIFQEGDTGWINPIPFICDYVGKKTPITTQDNWLLKMVNEPHPYYETLHCIAWMPLPEPYREADMR